MALQKGRRHRSGAQAHNNATDEAIDLPQELRGNDRQSWARVPPGMAIWSVIAYLESYDWDTDRTVEGLARAVSRDDVEYARRYYAENPEAIDAKLNAL